jgi:hypothetical protein
VRVCLISCQRDHENVHSEEGLSAKEGLLLWCQRKTAPYKEVDVQDFSYSWTDGLALCALIHCHRPDLLDYDKLDKSDRHANTRLAFTTAAEHLKIPQLLEVEDLCDSLRPDERSVMIYVASYFHAFSTMDQAETVSRRVEKFAELMQSVWVSRNDYERRARLVSGSNTMRNTIINEISFWQPLMKYRDVGLGAQLLVHIKTPKSSRLNLRTINKLQSVTG